MSTHLYDLFLNKEFVILTKQLCVHSSSPLVSKQRILNLKSPNVLYLQSASHHDVDVGAMVQEAGDDVQVIIQHCSVQGS